MLNRGVVKNFEGVNETKRWDRHVCQNDKCKGQPGQIKILLTRVNKIHNNGDHIIIVIYGLFLGCFAFNVSLTSNSILYNRKWHRPKMSKNPLITYNEVAERDRNE